MGTDLEFFADATAFDPETLFQVDDAQAPGPDPGPPPPTRAPTFQGGMSLGL